jgi:protein-tyrosine phosphatase
MSESLLRISNFKKITESLAIGGQPAEPYFPLLPKAGFEVVVHVQLTNVGTLVNNEDLLVEENGMSYVKIIIDFNNPKVDEFLYMAQILDHYRKERVFAHCTTGYSTSTLIIPYLMLKNEWSLSETLESVIMWNITPKWGQSLEAAIAAIQSE